MENFDFCSNRIMISIVKLFQLNSKDLTIINLSFDCIVLWIKNNTHNLMENFQYK